jgi:hypothetical protein
MGQATDMHIAICIGFILVVVPLPGVGITRSVVYVCDVRMCVVYCSTHSIVFQ